MNASPGPDATIPGWILLYLCTCSSTGAGRADRTARDTWSATGTVHPPNGTDMSQERRRDLPPGNEPATHPGSMAGWEGFGDAVLQ